MQKSRVSSVGLYHIHSRYDTFAHRHHQPRYCTVAPCEQNQVLRTAGSYGKQLGRMMAVVNILLDHVPLEHLSEQDRADLAKFRETSIEVDTVVAAETNRPRRQFSPADIEGAIDALRELAHTDPLAHRRLTAKLGSLPPPSGTT